MFNKMLSALGQTMKQSGKFLPELLHRDFIDTVHGVMMKDMIDVDHYIVDRLPDLTVPKNMENVPQNERVEYLQSVEEAVVAHSPKSAPVLKAWIAAFYNNDNGAVLALDHEGRRHLATESYQKIENVLCATKGDDVTANAMIADGSFLTAVLTANLLPDPEKDAKRKGKMVQTVLTRGTSDVMADYLTKQLPRIMLPPKAIKIYDRVADRCARAGLSADEKDALQRAVSDHYTLAYNTIPEADQIVLNAYKVFNQKIEDHADTVHRQALLALLVDAIEDSAALQNISLNGASKLVNSVSNHYVHEILKGGNASVLTKNLFDFMTQPKAIDAILEDEYTAMAIHMFNKTYRVLGLTNMHHLMPDLLDEGVRLQRVFAEEKLSPRAVDAFVKEIVGLRLRHAKEQSDPEQRRDAVYDLVEMVANDLDKTTDQNYVAAMDATLAFLQSSRDAHPQDAKTYSALMDKCVAQERYLSRVDYATVTQYTDLLDPSGKQGEPLSDVCGRMAIFLENKDASAREMSLAVFKAHADTLLEQFTASVKGTEIASEQTMQDLGHDIVYLTNFLKGYACNA